LLHRENLTQITTDHSWVEAQVQARLLTREQAHKHPQRNLITRALGLRPEVQVDPFEVKLRKGDLLLLCSDGLSGELTTERIADILRSRPPAEAATELVAQANAHGGGDNASAIVVQTETRRTRAPRRTADATPVEAPQRPGPAARLLARLSRRAHPESTAGGTTDDET
jgi:protein phosphatase